MKAEAVVYALLSGAAAVTAITSTRIFPGMLPLGQTTPAIVFEHISSVQHPVLDADVALRLYQSRMQINLLGADYATLKTLRDAVVAALQYQRGTIASTLVHLVEPSFEGPVTFDEELALFHRPLDFLVHHSA